MPFNDSSNRVRCMAETTDAISMLESIMDAHPDHEVILGGDFNTEMKDESPFDVHWNQFAAKYKLKCCDEFYPHNSITYRHKTLNQAKFSDHFLVSDSIANSGMLSQFVILDEGDNQSDHLPIKMTFSSDFSHGFTEQTNTTAPESLKWSKLNDTHKKAYTERVDCFTRNTMNAACNLHCARQCHCDDAICKRHLQLEYENLVKCMKDADSPLPRFKPGIEKDWWTEDLTRLKQQSIEIHSLWIREGRPRHGPTHEERIRVRAIYKRAIRAAQRAPKQGAWNRMHSSLCDKETGSFWRAWKTLYNKNKGSLAPVVNGCSSKASIADCFRQTFQKNSVPNNREKVDKLNERFAAKYQEYEANHDISCDCKSNYISPLNVIDALGSMKCNKSADENGISAEHFHFAPLSLLLRFTALFNEMIRHSFVPKEFKSGFMIPIVKDPRGNKSDPSNYRGITISPIPSKLFEHVLKIVFCDSLKTSQFQFGFKRKSSTTHALHCLKETVDYYVNHGSRVFCSFLDASKAFDRLVHSGLFIKLMERGVPLPFLKIIMAWYDGLSCRVKWGDQYSSWFDITAGVRQGGVLSPDLYSIYVDDLISQLMSLNKGCYFGNIFAAALFYADDMAILAPSIRGLQALLDVCEAYCLEWDIGLNAKKTKNVYFGKRAKNLFETSLNGKSIEWVDQWNYLGVTLKSGIHFGCSVKERVKKFYRCANAILRIDGRSDEIIMLQLLESHCVPLLTYAVEMMHVPDRDEKRQLRVAYNSIFRKLFGYRWSQSVTALQHFLDRPTWEELVDERREGFVTRVNKCDAQSLPRATLPT